MRHGGFVAGRSRLALDHRLGLGDLDGHALRQLDGDDDAVMNLQENADAVLKEDLVVADHVGRHHDLLIAYRLHEVEAFAILVKIVVFALIDMGALDLLGGLPALGDLVAVRDAAQIDLRRRRALAGVEVGRRQDDMKTAVDFDDIAFAKA